MRSSRARQSSVTLAAALGCVTLLFSLAYVAGADAPPRLNGGRAGLATGDAASNARHEAAQDEALRGTTACHVGQSLQLRLNALERPAQRVDTRLDILAAEVAQLTVERAQRFSNVVSKGSPLRTWLLLPLRAQGPPAQS